MGQRFLERKQPGLEAQITNLADAIAYNNHDVDDGFRAGLLSLEQLREQKLFNDQFETVRQRYPALEDRRLIYEIMRRMINKVVTDLIDTTQANIESAAPQSINDVRNQKSPLVAFSPDVYAEHVELKRFLNKYLYHHDKVLSMTGKAQAKIEVLFERYMSDPAEMPAEFSDRATVGDEDAKARVVADYIAGMTDRFAVAEHERLT